MTDVPILDELRVALAACPDDERLEFINTIRTLIHEFSPEHHEPVDLVRWVPIDRVRSNSYNPNSVASTEMGLLLTSILHDGYTQPVVTVWDPTTHTYEIVDGFHRFWTMKTNEELRARTGGMLPIVVLDKTMAERMAATVRHNRARGKHSIQGMSNLVFGMLREGLPDEKICNELGMEPQELIKLKHITGFSALFRDHQYSPAWETDGQVAIRRQYEAALGAKEAAAEESDDPPNGSTDRPARRRRRGNVKHGRPLAPLRAVGNSAAAGAPNHVAEGPAPVGNAQRFLVVKTRPVAQPLAESNQAATP